MKKDLIITRLETHSKEWHDFRMNGVGGSEIGDICGLSSPKYNRTINHFHNKVGDIPSTIPDNPKMFFGRYWEDGIAKIWQYHDGSEFGFIDNYKNDRIIRTCRNVNGYVVNPAYPWLFGSVDRLINIKGGVNLLTGEALKTEAILECKTLSYNASRVWEDGLPPSYLAQIHVYMIIFETDYAELAVLRDGNDFFVQSFQRDEELCKTIINISKGWWYNRVLPAKELYAKMQEASKQGNIFEAERIEGEMQRYEPDPDGSAAYSDFMNERFLKTSERMEGTIELFDICKKDKVLKGVENIVNAERDKIKNTILKELVNSGSEGVDFGSLGYVSWNERKGSRNRTMLNQIKEKPSEDVLKEEFGKIDLNCY